MPAVQTTYNQYMGVARAGMRANEEPVVLISRNVETAAGIAFGVPVGQGVRDDGCVIVAAGMASNKLLGVTMLQRNTSPDNPDKFGQYDAALIMNKGVIWVTADRAVAAGDLATVTLATAGIGNAAVAAGIVGFNVPARWESSTTGAGQLAKLRLG